MIVGQTDRERERERERDRDRTYYYQLHSRVATMIRGVYPYLLMAGYVMTNFRGEYF